MTNIRDPLTLSTGSLKYMDPRAANGDHDKSADFYSFCALTSEVLTGKDIPTIKDIRVVMNTKVNVRPPFPEWLSDELRSHLLSGFQEDIAKRSSWDDVIEALGNQLSSEFSKTLVTFSLQEK